MPVFEQPFFKSIAANPVLYQPFWQQCLCRLLDFAKRLESRQLAGFRSIRLQTPHCMVHALEYGHASRKHLSYIFLHGFAGQAIDWAPLLRELRGHCQHLVALSLPAHGQSQALAPVDGRMSEELLLTTLHTAVAQILGKHFRCILVGNSLGGLGVLRLTQRLPPKQVAGLILLSPFGAPMTEFDIKAMQKRFRIMNYQEAKEFMGCLHAVGDYMAPAVIAAAWAHINRPALQAMLLHLPKLRFMTPAELQKMPHSMLVWGNADRILPHYTRDFFMQHLPQCEAHTDDIFGHIPFLDAPHLLSRYIVQFVKRLGPG